MKYARENADFTFYHDPGHGWLWATLEDLKEVGLGIGHFSSYSPPVTCDDGSHGLYLEEDCDLGIFLQAYKAKHGKEPSISEHYIDDRALIGL